MIGLGTFYGLGKEVAEELKKVTGTDATVINPYYITGIDAELLEELKKDHDVVITLEDGILDGGFGEKIARFYGDSDMKVLNFGLKKEFLDRYDVAEVLKENHLTKEQIVEDVRAYCKKCIREAEMSLFLGLVVQSVANNVLNNVRNVTEKV